MQKHNRSINVAAKANPYTEQENEHWTTHMEKETHMKRIYNSSGGLEYEMFE